MFLENFTNYLFGHVEFETWGGFPERFANLCSRNGIFIRGLKREGEKMYGCVDAKDYKKLRPFAKKSGMKLRAVKKTGLPFLIMHNKNRIALSAALPVFVLTVTFLSRFIWTVDVQGNKNIPAEDIVEQFSKLGVKPGKRKSNLDVNDISDKALLEIDGLEWASVNINGCSATIEVREKTPVPEFNKKSEKPSNIRANISGVIERIDLYKGTKCVNVSDAVRKGDILVTGAVTNKDTSVSFYPSSAYIAARTKRDITVQKKNSEDFKVYTKSKKRFYISFFSLEFPINFLFLKSDDYDYFKSSSFIEMNGRKLPVGIICEEYDVYEYRTKKLDKRQRELYALGEYMLQRNNLLEDKRLVKEYVTENENGIEGEFECVESIGEEEEMDITLDFGENDE